METTLNLGSQKTPTITVDPEKGIIHIEGRSNPENSSDFYKPLLDWMDSYIVNPASKTELHINLEHFNTSSSKCILDLFKRMKKIKESNRDFEINWYYEEDDEEMLETAEIYEGMTNLEFKKIAVAE